MTVFSEHYAHARCSVLNYEVLMCISAERTVSHGSVRWKKRNAKHRELVVSVCVLCIEMFLEIVGRNYNIIDATANKIISNDNSLLLQSSSNVF